VSRGPGRVERAIEATFKASPDQTFTIEELAAIVYPGATYIEKRHRVCVIRAAKKVAAKLYWYACRADTPGSALVYCNGLDVRAYARGHARASVLAWADDPVSIERRLDDPQRYECKNMQPGGRLWREVEINKLRHQGDIEKAQALEAELERERKVFLGLVAADVMDAFAGAKAVGVGDD
jgi:hypothetical protein